MGHAPKRVKKFARILGHRLTRHELMFLRKLCLAQVASFDFQVRIGFYIADFVFPFKMLIIELDGPSHAGRKQHDSRRDEFLTEAGFTVWRIPNAQVSAWSLSKLRDYERPATGRGYSDALKWANDRHAQAEKQKQPKKVKAVKVRHRWTKDELKEHSAKDLAAITVRHQNAEAERKQTYKDQRNYRAQLPRVIQDYLGRC